MNSPNRRWGRDEAINFVLRCPSAVRRRVRARWWRVLGASIAPGCWVQDARLPRNPWDVELRAGALLDRNVILLTTGARAAQRRIVIGRDVYINRFSIVDASERIEIGDCTMIGPHCYITDHDHGTQPGHPYGAQALVSAPVRIGSNVWLGAGVIVLKGVSIGDGAIVGAGSVVTRDIAPGARVAGVPARPLPNSPAAPTLQTAPVSIEPIELIEPIEPIEPSEQNPALETLSRERQVAMASAQLLRERAAHALQTAD